MRASPLVLAAALLASCGAPVALPRDAGPASTEESAVDNVGARYGLSVTIPSGWDGEVARGALRFANRPLPALCGGPRPLGPGDLVLEILEREPPPGEQSYFPPLDEPPELHTQDLGPPEPGTYPDDHAVASVPFSLGGRFFVLFAESGAQSVDSTLIDRVNQILATLQVDRGDFYPGEVEPAAFRPADGWRTGSSGPRPIEADGDWTVSWAATVPYRDPWEALPMQETLESLPDDGIVIWVSLSRWCDPDGSRERFRVLPRPYQLSDFDVLPGWEGQIRDIPEYRLWTQVEGEYEVDLRVYFGSPDPTEDMLARAQGELDRLELPDWGPWELR